MNRNGKQSKQFRIQERRNSLRNGHSVRCWRRQKKSSRYSFVACVCAQDNRSINRPVIAEPKRQPLS